MKQQLGIFSWFGFVMPLPERLELIKKAGFTATSLWWEDEVGPKVIAKKEMAQMVKDSGLLLENIHAAFTDLNWLWSENRREREKIIKIHREWLEDCAYYEIPIMVMHLMEGESPPAPNKYGIESMICLVRAAEELGVKIAVENTRRTDNLALVLSEVKSSQLGLCYDSSHANLVPNAARKLLEGFGDRLLATHISDNDGQADRHWLPGNGKLDWQQVVELFPKEYGGCLTMEVVPDEKERQGTPTQFLDKAFQRISWVKAQLQGGE